MDKPNCYECKFRRNVPGDAHSQCVHPLSGNTGDIFFQALVDLVNGKYAKAITELNISGDDHGIRSGWFLWPVNFDPVWLKSCNGFTKKDEK